MTGQKNSKCGNKSCGMIERGPTNGATAARSEMARVAMAHAAAHRAADRVRLLFPVSSPPLLSSVTSTSSPLSSATDGKKYSAISGEASSGKLPITLTLVICSAAPARRSSSNVWTRSDHSLSWRTILVQVVFSAGLMLARSLACSDYVKIPQCRIVRGLAPSSAGGRSRSCSPLTFLASGIFIGRQKLPKSCPILGRTMSLCYATASASHPAHSRSTVPRRLLAEWRQPQLSPPFVSKAPCSDAFSRAFSRFLAPRD